VYAQIQSGSGQMLPDQKLSNDAAYQEQEGKTTLHRLVKNLGGIASGGDNSLLSHQVGKK
jgi:hypothetical protein